MSTKDTTAQKKPSFHIPETDLSSEEIRDILIKARVKLLISAPFFGNQATRLNLVDATSWCPTLATDGKNFYYNRNLVAMFNDHEGENEFGFGHEVLHCVYDHMGRRNRDWEITKNRKDFDTDEQYVDYVNNTTRQADIWNIANDKIVNSDLVEARIGKKIESIQIIYDHQARGKTSEELYDEMITDAEENGRVIQYSPFDMHLDGNDAGEEDDAPGTGNNDGTNGPIRYTQEEKEQISQEVQSTVLQSARGQDAGNLPSGVKRLIDTFLSPQLNWRDMLPTKIQSTVKSDYTYRRPSRKGVDAGFYLPSMDYDESIDIAIAIDTSGSMSQDMLQDILSETQGCMDQYTNFNIHLFCFDTEVHNPQDFDENNIDEFLEYESMGGGGTDFMCCWDYMKDQGINPKLFVMFTDGYPWNSWGDENYCETLFIVHGGYNGQSPEAPFGTSVHYERAS